MKLSINSYKKAIGSDVLIQNGAIKNLQRYAEKSSKTVIIADEKAYKLWQDELKQALPEGCVLLLVEGGDKYKSLEIYERLMKQMLSTGCDRHSLVISFGGGAVSDLAGFVASSYMRGLDWVVIPTTLAAQADAAIGGKTGVNLDGYKNMVGAFWPPLAVLIDPNFLKTLERRELVSGLGEIIKMGFIHDKNILKLVDEIDPENLLGDKLDQASAQSATAKIEIVNQDMLETNERRILNFGHTIGHAVESISLETKNPLLHGEAVSIGIVAETKLAELEGLCEPGLVQTVVAALNRFTLPTQISGLKPKKVTQKILSDKKNQANTVLWTLPVGVGQGIYNHQAKPEYIQKAIEFIC